MAKKIGRLVTLFFNVRAQVGGVEQAAVTAGAKELVAWLSPPQHREAALKVLESVPDGTGPDEEDLLGDHEGAALVIAMAAPAAWLGTRPKACPVPLVKVPGYVAGASIRRQ